MNNSKQNLLSVMEYHGRNIAFQEIEGKLMINATQMAKSFGKTPKDWLRTQQAKDLVKTVSVRQNCLTNDLQKVKQGGKNQGTWFQEDVALFFAQWLNPDFYLACNSKLKELLTQQALIQAAPVQYEIEGIIHEGKPVFPYSEACKKLGKIKYPKASRRKALHPDQFVKVYGRNFVTEPYLKLLKGYYDYKNASNQLNLEL